MHLTEWSLREPAGRAARVAALQLLGRVRSTRDRLDDAKDSEALHDFRVAVRRLRSWLRAFERVFDDTLSAKTPRRLKRIAEATGASRDLEVHLAWVEERRRSLRGEQRQGAEWLLRHLRQRKTGCDVELRQIVDAEFDRATKRVESAMCEYRTSVVETEPRFASVAARLVRRHASALAKALRSVSGIGDRGEAHTARIAAKRLRYLLDPLGRAIPDARGIVDELGELQDQLGALHDAQVFGSEIASAVAEQLAARGPVAVAEPGRNAKQSTDDPVPGLLAFARRLRRAEEEAFAAAKQTWLVDAAAPLLGRVAVVADTLAAIGKEGREVKRTYLLKALPHDMPAASIVEIDHGVVPTQAFTERVRREQWPDETRYYRIVKGTDGTDSRRIEETATERVFCALWPLTKGTRVHATRHRVDANDSTWDVYEFPDRQLVLATVEVDTIDSVPALPDWLEPVVERDVTGDASVSRPIPID